MQPLSCLLIANKRLHKFSADIAHPQATFPWKDAMAQLWHNQRAFACAMRATPLGIDPRDEQLLNVVAT